MSAPTQPPPALDEPRVLWNVRIPMRDGIELANNVYLPPTGVTGGPYPVIFARNPYNRQLWADTLRWRFFTEHGYVMVSQDCRGRFDSDGEFYPFFDDGPDAYDSIEWIAQQPWCTGKIGMMGGVADEVMNGRPLKGLENGSQDGLSPSRGPIHL